MKSDLVELTLRLHHITDRAILVSEDGNENKAKWIPLSQCEVETKPKGIVIVTMPEWLATDKGFV
jgi:hypothetical protein